MDEEYFPEEAEENLYSESVREDQVESDEISPEEEAFMKGYDEADDEEDDEDSDKHKDRDEEDEEDEE